MSQNYVTFVDDCLLPSPCNNSNYLPLNLCMCKIFTQLSFGKCLCDPKISNEKQLNKLFFLASICYTRLNLVVDYHEMNCLYVFLLAYTDTQSFDCVEHSKWQPRIVYTMAT